MAWILQNVVRGRSRDCVSEDCVCGGSEDNICCSTVDSWLVFKLCGGEPVTDASNASRTQLFNIHALEWDDDICGRFGIKPSMLPSVRDSNHLFGYTDFEGILEKPVALHGVMGDSHGALFGQGCVKPGMVKATYGTGTSVMMNIGTSPRLSDKGIVTSLAWSVDGKAEYVFEGNINYSGAVIKWLADDLGMISSEKEAGELAKLARKGDGMYIVPAFTGLGAPHWKPDATGLLCGITRNTGKAELVRAAEESIAYQIKDILELMADEVSLNKSELELRVDGGAVRDSYLMQFQADILNASVAVAPFEELSGSGPAYLAGAALGFYGKEMLSSRTDGRVFVPDMDEATRASLYEGWRKALNLVINN
jgi:glycerol kinase